MFSGSCLKADARRERAKLSRHNEVAKAFDYMLKRIDVTSLRMAKA
jgi:hypothetical protein